MSGLPAYPSDAMFEPKARDRHAHEPRPRLMSRTEAEREASRLNREEGTRQWEASRRRWIAPETYSYWVPVRRYLDEWEVEHRVARRGWLERLTYGNAGNPGAAGWGYPMGGG